MKKGVAKHSSHRGQEENLSASMDVWILSGNTGGGEKFLEGAKERLLEKIAKKPSE